ncbi:hypothetical protein OIU84_002123 [Salix udensis]|uniref:DUF7725 domain-containing protein n=1 Tax=Salix udensis TaxID=889485 RepID=A0AAD6P7H3_9ROSI|nr:hypothetical protein OIU84_002123 [Salix udensis]
MEATAGVTAASRVSLSRKEWRAVTEQQHRNSGGGDEVNLEHSKGPVDVDFCSITVDGGLDDDILRQQIHSITRQREELQRMETELRAQAIAGSEIMEMQKSFHAQIKELEDAAAKLQEQLHERGQTIHDLERRMEDKDRELHAIKLDNEAAWAKEDLLREQNKELATFRREHDHSEAERAQHIQQLHDVQEHIQDKERQILELQEQHRADQETIYLKDEQLKVWIAHHYNQLWLGCQRQFAEMERVHLHTVQQLQFELADARERSGSYADESHLSQSNTKVVSNFIQNNGNQLDVNGIAASIASNGTLSNGNADNAQSFVSTGNAHQTNHVAGAPNGSNIPTRDANLPSTWAVPAMSSVPQWQNGQAVTENAPLPTQNQLAPSQADHNLMSSDGKYDYERSVNGQEFHPDYLDVHISQGAEPDSVISTSTGESQGAIDSHIAVVLPLAINLCFMTIIDCLQKSYLLQVIESIDRGYLVNPQPEQSLQEISSQFSDALRLHPPERNTETKDQNVLNFNNHSQALMEEQASPAASASLSETSTHSVNVNETTINNGTAAVPTKALISSEQTIRTIPAGGRIRINSTLPNRLGKMLSPLHWHDYKKKYGKLDDFVGGHPELFLIEGDFIQLREGAQEMIAATSAVAKVAAAAAASSPYSSFLPSVAVTPMAQSHRFKEVPSIESKFSNGVNLGAAGGISNVKVLSKSKDYQELNGPDSDRSSVSSTQSKGSLHGMSNSIYTGKQQSRTTGAALTSRR